MNKQSLIFPTLFSIVLHIVLVFVVFYHLDLQSPAILPAPSTPSAKPPKVVQAVAVNQAAVEKEVLRLNQQAAQKQADQRAKQAKIAQQKLALQRERQRTAKALAALNTERKRLAGQQSRQQSEQKKFQQAKTQWQRHQAEQALQQKLALEQQQMMQQQQRRVDALISKYNALILATIRPNFIVTPRQAGLSTDVFINLAKDGTVLNVTTAKSSGSPVFDRAAIAAVYKSSPLPVPKDSQAFSVFKRFRLTLQPSL